MNLVLFLLSMLFASFAPATQTADDCNFPGTVNETGPGKGKGGKIVGGEYIIANDVHP